MKNKKELKIKSLEVIYREETQSEYPYERGFNGLKEEDYLSE